MRSEFLIESEARSDESRSDVAPNARAAQADANLNQGFSHIHTHTQTHTHIHIHIHISAQYIYLIDRARGPYGGILVEFSFYVFMDRAAGEVHTHVKRERDQYSPIRTECEVNK